MLAVLLELDASFAGGILLCMNEPACRQRIIDYIRLNAKPADKLGHQPRLYRLARQLGQGRAFDDDVVFAAAWLHDLGVFIGHRPEEPQALAAWDMIAYAARIVPGLLREFGFPEQKIPSVIEVIRTHQPFEQPATFEAVLLHDADILEQLGATAVFRTAAKVGRDTRFTLFSDAVRALRRNLEKLPSRLMLDSSRQLARPRLSALEDFLRQFEAEAGEEFSVS